jgi:hypothetical protein
MDRRVLTWTTARRAAILVRATAPEVRLGDAVMQ